VIGFGNTAIKSGGRRWLKIFFPRPSFTLRFLYFEKAVPLLPGHVARCRRRTACVHIGITMTIRKFNHWFTSDQLSASGSLPVSVRDIVIKLMVDRKNGIISGGTGSGKTTLMKALLDHVPQHERLVVIEQPADLKISQPNAIRWEAVEAIPGQVAITPSQLLAAALRHRPDRIIMGEIRDECGYDLLQAMNTGHGGTLSTIHAKSAWDALNRLSDLALSARPNLNHVKGGVKPGHWGGVKVGQ
jgi:type IV secretory pathway ATPase VirB11/archaellum biosynthesis ATPase